MTQPLSLPNYLFMDSPTAFLFLFAISNRVSILVTCRLFSKRLLFLTTTPPYNIPRWYKNISKKRRRLVACRDHSTVVLSSVSWEGILSHHHSLSPNLPKAQVNLRNTGYVDTFPKEGETKSVTGFHQSIHMLRRINFQRHLTRPHW